MVGNKRKRIPLPSGSSHSLGLGKKWKMSALPSEALSGQGMTDSDFFESLYASSHPSLVPSKKLKHLKKRGNGELEADPVEDLGADVDVGEDWMGLAEMEGVQVIREGNTVRLVPAQSKAHTSTAPHDAQKGTSKSEAGPEGDANAAAQALDALQEHQGDLDDPTAVRNPPETDSRAKVRKMKKKQANKQKEKISTRKDVEADESDVERADEQEEEPAYSADFKLLPVDAEADSDGRVSAEEAKVDGPSSPTAAVLRHWSTLPLHPKLAMGLHTLKFLSPTAIQKETLEISLRESQLRDVIGIAQTGSGKTLAYALPVLQWVLKVREDESARKQVEGKEADSIEEGDVKGLAALIMCPTRELALQVSAHIRALVSACGVAACATKKPLPFASLATLTGGMSEEKQRRLLNVGENGADIVVATPGRLWDMCSNDDELTMRIKKTKFLVVDEADRMIEAGHFREMEHILGLVRRPNVDHDEASDTRSDSREDMQTFIFSATLSKELQRNLSRKHKAGKARRRQEASSTMEDLLSLIDFRDEDPHIVDLSSSRRIAKEIREAKVECLGAEKDLYLYYFLCRYPGRCIVFLNSIDGIRRLKPLLANLGLDPQVLHSQLQQKQRLKALDRFKGTSGSSGLSANTSVLLATDVAARGLDVPDVDHVVHYQLPRSVDAFVHRSGRTGRAGKEGVSIVLVEPKEKRLWKDLCRGLGRAEDLCMLPIEYSFLPMLKDRLALSRQIDNMEHKVQKLSHEESWVSALAKEADLDTEEEMRDPDADHSTNSKLSNLKVQEKKRNVTRLKEELQALLQRPMVVRGASHKYITAGSKSAELLHNLLEQDDETHEHPNKAVTQMLGVQRNAAKDELRLSELKQKNGESGQSAMEASDQADDDAEEQEEMQSEQTVTSKDRKRKRVAKQGASKSAQNIWGRPVSKSKVKSRRA
ncbi:P-loop containing nucleoside triphosphate hydrolase protein [Ceraceosorus guamensis]|uniref:ATP-dependent RNA helicase n=1 Tax=Ceraceosorus guamensis TaxID=1522189 RepID=A0A316W1R7_9BASI|nr:P-loop containing nucleoside triphosphate hydrolase protein [Ceraceosorus guamensis]PWN43806.1 P-loop containing nucleoside triphosphate hydrolase protein [Ceraceosorus guamensis]